MADRCVLYIGPRRVCVVRISFDYFPARHPLEQPLAVVDSRQTLTALRSIPGIAGLRIELDPAVQVPAPSDAGRRGAPGKRKVAPKRSTRGKTPKPALGPRGRYPDSLDPARIEQYIMAQPNLRHSTRSAIQSQIPEGIPASIGGEQNKRYGRAAQLVKRVRQTIEKKTGGKFVPVKGGGTEVMLKA